MHAGISHCSRYSVPDVHRIIVESENLLKIAINMFLTVVSIVFIGEDNLVVEVKDISCCPGTCNRVCSANFTRKRRS